jgi:hypothetical protein
MGASRLRPAMSGIALAARIRQTRRPVAALDQR